MSENSYDVAIIGGGPSGTSAAYESAGLGLRTILLEKQKYPRDKPCGGALSGRCLHLLGKHAKESINCDIDELRLFAPSFKHFSYSGLAGYFVTRSEFDEAMAADAADAGARILDNHQVKRLNQLPDGSFEIHGLYNGTKIEPIIARFVIIASGFQRSLFNCPVLDRETYEDDFFAMTVVSETKIENEVLKPVNFSGRILGIFFGAVPNGYGWYFVKDGCVNIGIGATAKLLHEQGAMNAYSHFVSDLKTRGLLPVNLELTEAKAFPLPFKRTVRRSVFGNILLTGDAAGFVSPVTGEGLYYGILGGHLAARAIHDHISKGISLDHYQHSWEKAFGKNLNRYGYRLQRVMYKSKARMELAVTLGRNDQKMAEILNKLIYGHFSYGSAFRKILLRLPAAFFKSIVKSAAKN